MKNILYFISVILSILVFASCNDDDSVMAEGNEQYYEVLVSIPDAPITRASYKEDGENLAVVWEKGDEIYLGSNEFVFKEMQEGNKALFFHYGNIDNADNWKGNVTFGSKPGTTEQLQRKNNVCGELLSANVTDGINLSNRPTIPLLPADNMSLVHLQVKSPALFLGGSVLLISGLDKDYSISLGNNNGLVFADKDEILDLYLTVPSGMTIAQGTTLRFLFHEYDASGEGKEYGYYMKCNASISADNDNVLKMPLPNNPSRIVHVTGSAYANLAGGSELNLEGLKEEYQVNLDSVAKASQFDVYFLLSKSDTITNSTPLSVSINEPNDGSEYSYWELDFNEPEGNEVINVRLGRLSRAAIQMGLPSGTKWSAMNIGAETEDGWGLYFWWGDVIGYDDKTKFDFSNGKGNTSADTRFKDNETLRQEGIIDDSDNLVPERDAATQHWGSQWKMPTKEDFEELLNSAYCEWTPTAKGWEVISKKNFNTIFFPFGGYRNNNGTGKSTANQRCFYWSSTVSESISDQKLQNECAYGFQTFSKNNNVYPDPFYIINPRFGRYSGIPIRPVRSK